MQSLKFASHSFIEIGIRHILKFAYNYSTSFPSAGLPAIIVEVVMRVLVDVVVASYFKIYSNKRMLTVTTFLR